jgi:F-type H+-transporting ATPase subunit a
MNILTLYKKAIISLLAVSLLFINLLHASEEYASDTAAAHAGEGEEFNAGEFIIEHIKDSHEWHIMTLKNGEHVKFSLPVIIFSQKHGLNLFMSDKLAHGHIFNGFQIPEEGEFAGKIVEIDDRGEITGIPLDFSITKNVAAMMVAALLMLILFIRMGRIYSKHDKIIPKGFNGFLEPMIVFVRDGIAIPNIGHHKYEKYMPYLLTAFFFILLNNLLGLIPIFPFGSNVTGNISVTMLLAFLTFLMTQFSGTKTYWKHIVAAPGVPLWLAPIMIPVELIGIFTKPFALMIRLFANITAGHIVVLSLVCLIFIFKQIWVSSVAIPMVLFLDILEILVAFLQAYVFTLLSALFIGLATKEHHE